MGKLTKYVSGGMALLLLLTACGDGASEEDAEGAEGEVEETVDEDAADADPEEEPTTDASEADSAANGEVLRAALSTLGQESASPYVASGASAMDIALTIMDPLVMVDADGSPIPGVAESWEFDDDGMGATFHIRDDMEFHNGDPLTAEDVVFSLQAWFDPEVVLTNTTPMWFGTIESPEAITQVDDYTIHVDTVAPAETLLQTFAPLESVSSTVVPKAYIEEVGWDEWNNAPIGTGPWEFESFERGEQFNFTARDEHPFREVPSFDRLELWHVPEEGTAESMLRAGEVDIAQISAEIAEGIDGEDNLRVHANPGNTQSTIIFQGTWRDDAGPLGDARVRQAMSLAIDRQAIVDEILLERGSAAPSGLVANIWPGTPGLEYEDWEIDDAVYDPERARELLEEAGADGGFEVDLYVYTQSGSPPGDLLGEIYSGFWQEFNITTNLIPIDLATIETMSAPGEVDEDLYPSMKIHRRRRVFSDATSLGRYEPTVPHGEVSLGPDGEGHIPDVSQRYAELLQLAGEERTEHARELGEDLSELYVQVPVVNMDVLWGIGNNAGEWAPIEVMAQAGLAYNTVKQP